MAYTTVLNKAHIQRVANYAVKDDGDTVRINDAFYEYLAGVVRNLIVFAMTEAQTERLRENEPNRQIVLKVPTQKIVIESVASFSWVSSQEKGGELNE